jgi:hypothetical protein
MGGQLVYTILTELPAVYLLYDSSFWSAAFLLGLFSVSVWNGGGFYIEVFGRKFERELEALRKELAESTARSGHSSPINGGPSEEDLSAGSPPLMMNKKKLPSSFTPDDVPNPIAAASQPPPPAVDKKSQ